MDKALQRQQILALAEQLGPTPTEEEKDRLREALYALGDAVPDASDLRRHIAESYLLVESVESDDYPMSPQAKAEVVADLAQARDGKIRLFAAWREIGRRT